VRYSGIAPGVDILFSGEDEHVSWEYVFSTDALSAETIAVFEGASSVRVEAAGDLRIDAGMETLRVARPVSYQIVNGEHRAAVAAYEVVGPGRVRIHSTWPDRSRPLVIDPILSQLSTAGGSAADTIYSVAAAPNGGVYLAGETRSVDIPGAVGRPPSGSNTQILLIKLSAAGEVEYTVLAGGSGDDVAYGVAVDAEGRVHLTGRTSSPDFPVTRGAQQTSKGGGWDAFYLSMSPNGKTVRAATYLGGAEDDKGQAIGVDRAGSVYIAGSTLSDDFPGTSGKRRGMADAFVAKLNPNTARARYIALLGGSGEDYANALTVDTAGDVWVAGQTNSADLPVAKNPVQREKHGLWDAFLARLDGNSGRLRYATFLGGGAGPQSRGIDNALAVSVDSKGSVWVAGETDSADFPVTDGALERTNSARRKAFVMRLDEGATIVGYATYLGGGGESTARTVVAGTDGRVVVSGTSWSKDFPATPQLVTDGSGGSGDMFTLVLDRDRGNIVCAARLGGAGEDRAGGAVIVPGGWVLIAGSTQSDDLASRAGVGGHVFFATLRCDAK
jgi:hypothetical protein